VSKAEKKGAISMILTTEEAKRSIEFLIGCDRNSNVAVLVLREKLMDFLDTIAANQATIEQLQNKLDTEKANHLMSVENLTRDYIKALDQISQLQAKVEKCKESLIECKACQMMPGEIEKITTEALQAIEKNSTK